MLALQYPPPSVPRASNDSFLPSGAVPDDLNMHLAFPGLASGDSSSVISPLALPRGATQYFDAHHHLPAVRQYHPGSSLAPVPAQQPQQQQQQQQPAASPAAHLARSVSASGSYVQKPQPSSHFISPRLAPTSTQMDHQLRQQTRNQQRSASLSPTRRSVSLAGGSAPRNRSAVASPSRVPLSGAMFPLNAAVAPFPGAPASAVPAEMPSVSFASMQSPMLQARAVSGDAAVSLAGHQAQLQRIALLEKQNALIRQSWENERRYLEANRSRAEEVYQEERAIMDMERSEWEAERAALVDEIVRLKDQAKALRSGGRFNHVGSIPEEGGLVPSLRGGGSNDLVSPGSALAAPVPPLQGASQHQWGARAAATQTAAALQSQPSQSHADAATCAIPAGAKRISPSRQPESSPFIPLTQAPQHPVRSPISVSSELQLPAATMPSAPHTEDGEPVPTIDVQDIHPELEGIPLKKTAVQKATFTDADGSNEGSKAGSKPPSAEPEPPLPADAQRPDYQERKVSEKDPLKVLAASEPERLRMNAGHTPNHSLSVLPSGMSTEAHTTASSSGEATPTTATGFDGGSSTTAVDRAKDLAPEDPLEPPATKEAAELDGADAMGPDEDRPLTGPLHLRNLPAKDAKFFDLLDKKLEHVSKGETEDALPKVLRNDALAGPSDGADDGANGAGEKAPAQKRESASQHSSQGSSRSEPDTALEIPLRIRKTSNFGAPLGEIRGPLPH